MTSSPKLMMRVPLDAKELTQNLFDVQTDNDGTFRSEPSPYDVPVEIIGEYEPEKKLFSLELNYIADEPKVSKNLESDIVVESGKNSGRIYQINIKNTDVRDSRAIRDGIDKAVQFISQQKSTPRFEIAKRAIDGVDFDSLLSGLIDTM